MDPISDEYVVHGRPLTDDVPKHSFGITVHRYLKEHYNLPIALIDAVTRKSTSYKTLFDECSLLAHSLQKYGITENDTIAISSENSPLFAFPLIAGLWSGATVTLFNPLYTPREIAHVLNISKPTVIFCSKTSLQSILQVPKDSKSIKKIIVIDGNGTADGADSLESFMINNSKDYRPIEPVDVDCQHTAFILYSSGTTGLPKGVMLTHYNMNLMLIYFGDPSLYLQNPPGEFAGLVFLPCYHVFGLSMLLRELLFGRTLVIMSKFDGDVYLKAVNDFKIETLSAVPSLANFLAMSPIVDEYDLSHVRLISSGSCSLGKRTQDMLTKRFIRFNKDVRIREGYGLTETLISTLAPLELIRVGSVGKCLPGTSVKIVDVTSGKSLGPGGRGELYIRGPHIMKGYANDVGSTNDAIDKDGWFRTGDMGYYDQDGYFYIVERLKDLIKYKGYQVSPAEIEQLLLTHPKVADAAVVGVPDEIAGELPLAFVVKKSGQDLFGDDVKNFIAEQVAPHKQLRGGVRFIQDIPKNPAGKILKKDLRQLLTEKSQR